MSSTGPTPPNRAPRAARNLLAVAGGGTGEPYAPVPFFWSDQAKHRIQFLGRSATTEDGDVVEVVVGSTDGTGSSPSTAARGRLWGALGVNCPRLVMPYRKLLDESASWDDAMELAASQRAAQQT